MMPVVSRSWSDCSLIFSISASDRTLIQVLSVLFIVVYPPDFLHHTCGWNGLEKTRTPPLAQPLVGLFESDAAPAMITLTSRAASSLRACALNLSSVTR